MLFQCENDVDILSINHSYESISNNSNGYNWNNILSLRSILIAPITLDWWTLAFLQIKNIEFYKKCTKLIDTINNPNGLLFCFYLTNHLPQSNIEYIVRCITKLENCQSHILCLQKLVKKLDIPKIEAVNPMISSQCDEEQDEFNSSLENYISTLIHAIYLRIRGNVVGCAAINKMGNTSSLSSNNLSHELIKIMKNTNNIKSILFQRSTTYYSLSKYKWFNWERIQSIKNSSKNGSNNNKYLTPCGGNILYSLNEKMFTQILYAINQEIPDEEGPFGYMMSEYI